jgi:hypothetical protein
MPSFLPCLTPSIDGIFRADRWRFGTDKAKSPGVLVQPRNTKTLKKWATRRIAQGRGKLFG